jgi:hypothetical protein
MTLKHKIKSINTEIEKETLREEKRNMKNIKKKKTTK